MPNQRSKGQKLVNVPMHEDFLEALDTAVVASHLGDRSKFIRTAIYEKAAALGVSIPSELVGGPPRFGRSRQSSSPETTGTRAVSTPSGAGTSAKRTTGARRVAGKVRHG